MVTLLVQVDAYLRKTGMPWTRFGRLATHDPRFVGDLRNGRSPRPETVERVERFMAAHPDGVTWQMVDDDGGRFMLSGSKIVRGAVAQRSGGLTDHDFSVRAIK